MLNVNDLLIEVKSKQSQLGEERAGLIREIFLLWYALLEDVKCENFSQTDLVVMLNKCIDRFELSFNNDADCTFMVGWTLVTAFWLFGTRFEENEGIVMLIAAYRTQPTSKLFKWAIRDELKLSNKEVVDLTTELKDNFYNYYNYGSYIKKYFLDVLN